MHLNCVCPWALRQRPNHGWKKEGEAEWMKNSSESVRLEKIKLLFLAPGYQHRVFPRPPSAIRGLMDDQPGPQQGALLKWWRSDSGCESKRFWSQEEIVFSQTQPGVRFSLHKVGFLQPGWLFGRLDAIMYSSVDSLTIHCVYDSSKPVTHTSAKALASFS